MLWIKEVEMVDSVDDLMSLLSLRGIQMPNFEVLDARIASALNRIIHNSHFKRRISLEEQKAQKQDCFLRGRQIAYLMYEYFRVTGANDSVGNYADLFTVGLRNDDIQEFDSKWDGILLSMTNIPPDDILEGLYKLRIRESEKLKTVLDLYDLEIHQKKIGPDYHKLKTMVKRSIEQGGRGDGVPKACLEQAAADSPGSRTCVCAKTLIHFGVAHAGEKDELTSCRGTVKSAWQKPPASREGGRAGLPKKGKWPPRGTGTTVLTYPCPSQPCFGGSKECARVTGKAGEIGQHSGEVAGSSP